jgi:hypothetical protein
MKIHEIVKLHPRWSSPLIAFFMSALMAFAVTGVATAANTGVDATFVARWLRAYALAWPIAFLTALAIGPSVRRIVSSLVREPAAKDRAA